MGTDERLIKWSRWPLVYGTIIHELLWFHQHCVSKRPGHRMWLKVSSGLMHCWSKGSSSGQEQNTHILSGNYQKKYSNLFWLMKIKKLVCAALPPAGETHSCVNTNIGVLKFFLCVSKHDRSLIKTCRHALFLTNSSHTSTLRTSWRPKILT